MDKQCYLCFNDPLILRWPAVCQSQLLGICFVPPSQYYDKKLFTFCLNIKHHFRRL